MNIPNRITLFRTLLIPVFIFFLLYNIDGHDISIVYGNPIKLNILIAAIIFIFAAVTDFIDGYLARKYNLITNMGKFLDPLADKLLVGNAFIVMIELQMVPSWMVVIVIAREFAVTGLRLLAVEKGEVIAAGVLGKLKTIFQLVSISLILLGNPIFNMWNLAVDYWLLWISVLLTLASGIEYFINALHIFKNKN